MKKILIMGSAGMLGHLVHNFLRSLNKYELRNTSYPVKLNDESDVLDVTDKSALERYLDDVRPDILVNCIGVLIRGSNENPANAIYINSYFPHQLATILRKSRGRLIHISTDCVFTGEKGGYTESDIKDAQDIYGLSKSLGEVVNTKDLTIRTSVIGPELNNHGEGLFHWFMKQKGLIKGYTHAFWSGVTTLELAKTVDAAIEQEISGLYHLTPNIKISKFELLNLFKDTWNCDHIKINPIAGKLVDKSLINTRNDFRFTVGSYPQILQELARYMDEHPDLYGCLYK